jgi:hypothetical protein
MAGTTGMIIKLLLVISLLVGNYLGGRLIYQYFIGIELKNERNGKITA